MSIKHAEKTTYCYFLHHKIHSAWGGNNPESLFEPVLNPAKESSSIVWSRPSVSSASVPEAAAHQLQSNRRTARLIIGGKNCFFLGAVCYSGVTGILAQTVAGAGVSRCPRHTCFVHLEIFSRWHAKTLALCLYRLPHLAWASHSECRCHTSGFYTCTGWWHSACAAVPVLPQFNTHMKVRHLGLPWTCAAEHMLPSRRCHIEMENLLKISGYLQQWRDE